MDVKMQRIGAIDVEVIRMQRRRDMIVEERGMLNNGDMDVEQIRYRCRR